MTTEKLGPLDLKARTKALNLAIDRIQDAKVGIELHVVLKHYDDTIAVLEQMLKEVEFYGPLADLGVKVQHLSDELVMQDPQNKSNTLHITDLVMRNFSFHTDASNEIAGLQDQINKVESTQLTLEPNQKSAWRAFVKFQSSTDREQTIQGRQLVNLETQLRELLNRVMFLERHDEIIFPEGGSEAIVTPEVNIVAMTLQLDVMRAWLKQHKTAIEAKADETLVQDHVNVLNHRFEIFDGLLATRIEEITRLQEMGNTRSGYINNHDSRIDAMEEALLKLQAVWDNAKEGLDANLAKSNESHQEVESAMAEVKKALANLPKGEGDKP